MAGKLPQFASRRLAYAMDQLSKNTLVDILIDRARCEVGEDATDEQIAVQVERWLNPVAVVRGDKAKSLTGLLARHDGYERLYLERQAAGQL